MGTVPQSNGSMVESNPFTNRVDSVIGKIDYHLNASDLLTGRYYFGDSHQSFPLALVGGGVTPGYNTTTPTRVQIVSLSYTKVLNSKLLTEIRGGWNRFAEQFAAQDNTLNPATIGLASLSPSALPRDFGLPLITFEDGTSSIGANASVPRGRVDTNTQLFNNWSYTSGKHAWKFGAEFRRTTSTSTSTPVIAAKLPSPASTIFSPARPTEAVPPPAIPSAIPTRTTTRSMLKTLSA